MTSYVVCRYIVSNPTGNEAKQKIRPVAVFDTLEEAQKTTLKHDLVDRTKTICAKYTEWPLYTIFPVKRDWLCMENTIVSYHENCRPLYDFITAARDFYQDTKDLYDEYYAYQKQFVDRNNSIYEGMKTNGHVSRGWSSTDPRVIGFEPF